MENVLITGANRGIGLELVRQCLRRGDVVFACTRHLDGKRDLDNLQDQHPERLHIIQLAVDDVESIQAALLDVQRIANRLDLLVNNAGVFPRGEGPGNLEQDTLLNAFRVNAIGPVLVVQTFAELLNRGKNPRVVNITSQLGSLTNKQSGGSYSYCASKAALNMFSRALAHDLKSAGITVIALHPGWVKTDMGGKGASLTPERSVAGMLELISGLTLNESSEFFAWDGTRVPW